MANLEVEFCGLKFKNPLVVASGEPTNSAEHIKSSIDCGASGVIIKTLTDSAEMQNLTRNSRYAILNEYGQLVRGKVPRLYTFYSRSGFSHKDNDLFLAQLEGYQAYARQQGCHLIGSVGATSLDGWVEIAQSIEKIGLSLTELNFGCPHPSQMKKARTGMLIGQDADAAYEITRAVTKAVSIPVVVKLTPQALDLVEIAQAVREAGGAGVTLVNRFVGFAVDIYTGKPYIGGMAGVGGPWVKPLSLRWVAAVYKALRLPIMGSNGLHNWRDVVEFIMTGASLVQICSTIMLKGYGVVAKILEGLSSFMAEKDFPTLQAMKGIAVESALPYAELFHLPRSVAVINRELCNGCNICVRTCWYDAMAVGDGKPVVDEDACIGCELCVCMCPVAGAIGMQPREAIL